MKRWMPCARPSTSGTERPARSGSNLPPSVLVVHEASGLDGVLPLVWLI
jgi:hypothetical protein